MVHLKKNDMRKVLLVIFMCNIALSLHSQSFIWGKRGGAANPINPNGSNRQEEVYSIATDNNKNIFALSKVSMSNLNIDGIPKTYYGDTTSLSDVALSSFSCDGTYRWSKIIGGSNVEYVPTVHTDNAGNVYFVGKFIGCGDNNFPFRIDDDILISQSPMDCSTIFIVKYDNDGNLLWFRRPLPSTVTSAQGITNTHSLGFTVDEQGNSLWLVKLSPGIYADGAFNVVNEGIYILKYNTNGEPVQIIAPDMQLDATWFFNIQFYRSQYSGNFYFAAERSSSPGSAVLGGETMNNSFFLSSFTQSGDFNWVRQNTGQFYVNSFNVYNLAFDEEDNIYLGGRIAGINTTEFMGFSVSATTTPAFVMKINSSADTLLWGSASNKGSGMDGGIAIKDGELGLTSSCYSNNLVWGEQTLYVSETNQGTDVLLARFNTDTGSCVGLSKISSDVGSSDIGTALAVDASGDYLIGGGFEHYLYTDSSQLINTSTQSDFFIVKYASEACSELGLSENETDKIVLYPNPVRNTVGIEVPSAQAYSIYNVKGQLLLNGQLTMGLNLVNIEDIPMDTYILVLETAQGEKTFHKLIKM